MKKSFFSSGIDGVSEVLNFKLKQAVKICPAKAERCGKCRNTRTQAENAFECYRRVNAMTLSMLKVFFFFSFDRLLHKDKPKP